MFAAATIGAVLGLFVSVAALVVIYCAALAVLVIGLFSSGFLELESFVWFFGLSLMVVPFPGVAILIGAAISSNLFKMIGRYLVRNKSGGDAV